LRLLILVTFVFSLSGCAWISLDRYYGIDGTNDQWQSKFRPGKSSTKTVGYPDTQIHSFIHPEVELTLEISYQDIGAVGPLIIPFIPTPWDSSKNIMITATLYTESEIEIDFSTWQISTSGVKHEPKEVFVDRISGEVKGKVKLQKGSRIYLPYNLKAADVDSLSMEFGLIKAGQKLIKPPELNLLKTKGTWHYEAWTV